MHAHSDMFIDDMALPGDCGGLLVGEATARIGDGWWQKTVAFLREKRWLGKIRVPLGIHRARDSPAADENPIIRRMHSVSMIKIVRWAAQHVYNWPIEKVDTFKFEIRMYKPASGPVQSIPTPSRTPAVSPSPSSNSSASSSSAAVRS